MELIEGFLDKIESKHPKSIWFLARLIVSFGLIFMSVFGIATICLAIYPLIMLVAGKSIASFLIWFLLPVPIFITWVSSDITKNVYSEYINVGKYCWRA